MPSFVCENIHQRQERINDESRGRKEINLCLAALLCDQLLPICEWRCQDIDQVLLHGNWFLCSASSSSEVPGQSSSSGIFLYIADYSFLVSEECLGRMWDR